MAASEPPRVSRRMVCLSQAVADFVASLPAGLDTVTGDRGDWISGGEHQRIALGRS